MAQGWPSRLKAEKLTGVLVTKKPVLKATPNPWGLIAQSLPNVPTRGSSQHQQIGTFITGASCKVPTLCMNQGVETAGMKG